MKRFPNWRAGALGLCLIWGCYFVTMGRTTSFGLSWRSIGADAFMFSCFVLPLGVCAAIGLPWRKAGLIVLALAVGSILAAEVFAGAQEWLIVRRHGHNPEREVFVNRWPPFDNHHIAYSSGQGWIGGD